MSHYNSSSTGGSWQSQRNTQPNQSQESTSNLSGLFNSSAAANLLAQFSSLGNVNINNLAANLPAIVAATSTNSSNQSSAQNNQSSTNSSGYQWHSQNRLATQNNSNTSTSTNQSYLLGPGGTMSNSFNSSKNQTSQKSHNYDSKNESKNKSSSYSNYSSSSRDRTNKNRYQNQSAPKYESAPSQNNNQTAQIQNVLPNLNQNPLLTQALLTQLAQTAQQNQTNLVSALAAAVTGNNLNHGISKRSRSRSRSKLRSRSRSQSRDSSQRGRNGRLNRNDSNRDVRQIQNSSRSKSPANLTKRLSYSGSKPRDPRENKERDTFKENSRDPVKDSKIDSKEPVKEIKETKSRYSIKLPKLPIDIVHNNVCTLKQRYPLLYIPSDYIDSKNSWLNSFSLSKPFKLNNKCQFHVMSKDSLPLERNTSIYDPGDVDYRWQVKVMLLSMPSWDEYLKRCCCLAEENSKDYRYESPSKIIQFLVGNKGKHEPMALGGPWSPSLDGPNPATNTQTLINTAIRSVKALTGIDLSPCNQWFRFLDIQYNRNEEFKSETDASSQEESLVLDDEKYVENTVIFVPNVWSIMPTNVEYQKQVEAYQNLIDKEPDWVNEPVKEELVDQCNGDDHNKLTKAENDGQTEADSETNLTSGSINADDLNEPTHYSKLDMKKMKVDELRYELAARNLDTKGLKQHLVSRLKDALEAEKAQDGIDVSIDPKEASFLDDANDLSQQSLIMDEDLAKKESKEDKKPTQPYTWSKLSKSEREKAYRLPVTPHIIVHPSPTFKQNKFECQLVSLSHMLDYRKEDNKECSFEVFLFAECFHEMLLRDSVFQVYKHLLGLREDSEKTATNGKRKLSEEDTSGSKKSKTDEEIKKTDDQKQDKTFKSKTLFPDLLLSFTYIDSSRSNYINEKDFENLFYLIGLNLSRSKCKALLKKLNIRDGSFNYRTLTDRSSSSSSFSTFYKIPTDEEIINNIISFDSYLDRSGPKSEIKDTNQTFVEINGSTIDVLTTIKKLEKSEESLNEIDLKYKEALDELDRVKVLNRTLDRHKQKLVDEASELKKKLRDEQRFSKDSDDKYLRLKDCLYRTKTQLNKVLDDISDSTRRSQKNSDSNGKAVKNESDKKESDGKDGKKSDDETRQINENSTDNGDQEVVSDENKIEEIKNEIEHMEEEIKDDTGDNSNENEQSQGDMLEISSNEKTNNFDS